MIYSMVSARFTVIRYLRLIVGELDFSARQRRRQLVR